MAIASPPLALAATTQIRFRFAYRTVVKIQVRFFSDAAGRVPIAAGTGSRDITATHIGNMHDNADPPWIADVESNLEAGTLVGAVGGTYYQLNLADGLGHLALSASGGVNPGAAASYRIVVDAEGAVV